MHNCDTDEDRDRITIAHIIPAMCNTA